MKVNVFVQFLDEKGRATRSERKHSYGSSSSSSSDPADSSSLTNDPSFQLNLSRPAKDLSRKQAAIGVRDQNLDQNAPLERYQARSSSVPYSLSQDHELSSRNLKDILNESIEMAEGIADAHSGMDRKRIEALL